MPQLEFDLSIRNPTFQANIYYAIQVISRKQSIEEYSEVKKDVKHITSYHILDKTDKVRNPTQTDYYHLQLLQNIFMEKTFSNENQVQESCQHSII